MHLSAYYPVEGVLEASGGGGGGGVGGCVGGGGGGAEGRTGGRRPIHMSQPTVCGVQEERTLRASGREGGASGLAFLGGRICIFLIFKACMGDPTFQIDHRNFRGGYRISERGGPGNC